jgi:hypothetical protein
MLPSICTLDDNPLNLSAYLAGALPPEGEGGAAGGWGATRLLEPHYDSRFWFLDDCCSRMFLGRNCLTYTPPKASFIMSAGAT